ncbi:unnamed protein product [Allacma fusca]|uniref:C2H2-type domain-containing protein n=1 Tax=Allacma fusca TaxID=39272 RepID=A0A8J2NRG2_9HEXA|nr:unnamed protein product [Allacma fusca]
MDTEIGPKRNNRYNLRRKFKSTSNSLVVNVSDNDSTEDYQPEPEPPEEPGPLSEDQLKCEFCPKIFESKDLLEEHICDTHVVDKIGIHKCEFCPKIFKSKDALGKHISLTHVLDNDEKHKCEFCPKVCTNRYLLEKHICDTHVVDKEFQCTKCSKNFISKNKLDSHVLSRHAKRKNQGVKCPICGRAFQRKSDLSKHAFIHADEKPFKCDFCPKTFILRADCGLHMANRHGGEKPFKCPVCAKAFFHERDLLIDHLPYHSEERNFECDKCVAAFKTKRCLRQHVKKFCHARKTDKS